MLDFPNNNHEALHAAPAEAELRLKLELAVALYAQNAQGLGKTAELVRMSRLEINDILAKRSLPMHYGQQELDEDFAYVRSGQ